MKTDYLAHINSPADLKKLLPNQLPDLAQELEWFKNITFENIIQTNGF